MDRHMKVDMMYLLCIIYKHTLEIIHLGRGTKQPSRENDFYLFKYLPKIFISKVCEVVSLVALFCISWFINEIKHIFNVY